LEDKKTVTVKIPAKQGFSYPIIIGENLLDKIGSAAKKHTKAAKLLLVSNTTVFSLYGKQVIFSLKKEDFDVETIILPDGEKFKNIDSLETIWQKAIEYKLERKDAILALGGGVIGDMAGFAAATYLRGIDFIQIPTTLLAQVDSSVGGKVAVNHKLGKNLIGNFYQPNLVLADTTALKTLSEEELKVGLAEVLKYAFIENSCTASPTEKSFIEYLKENKAAIFTYNDEVLQEVVKYCCELKATVVNKDEKESGMRAYLNFGHTIGHAIEKCCGYNSINHGQAISIGMRGVLYISKKKNLIDENYYKKCIALLDLYGLNYKIPQSMPVEEIYLAMFNDKKVLSGKVRFVLSVAPAEVKIYSDIEKDIVIEAIQKLY